MSVIHFGQGQTPVNKQVMATDATTTATIWTPASGKKIVLTDLNISANNVVAGTVRFYFYPSADTTTAPTLLLETVYTSGQVNFQFDTPKVNTANDGVLRVVSYFGNNIYINMGGFEI